MPHLATKLPRRKAAADWLAQLESDDRVARAELALQIAQGDAREKSTAKDCGKNCPAILGKTVDGATLSLATRSHRCSLRDDRPAQRWPQPRFRHQPLPWRTVWACRRPPLICCL